jgi:predicted DNA-binding protein with PD1-like motif
VGGGAGAPAGGGGGGGGGGAPPPPPPRLASYDQTGKTYGEFALEQPLEITALAGNLSRRDGDHAAHVHLTLAASDGRAFGGHAAPGCVVFACELVVTELLGQPLERVHDEVTGLPLWRGL